MASPAQTIGEVIERLTEIVDASAAAGSRLGYFAALYRKVTVRVRDQIDAGFFDDGERMTRLDVIFANRYLAAHDRHQEGGAPTRAWAYAFEVADHWWPVVLQHLLLGMNAHINLDLGIAAAETVPAAELPALEPDFNRINTTLSELVGEVKEELARIWLTLRLFNRFLGRVEDKIINFSMRKARDHAWSVAERLAPLDEAGRAEAIVELDANVALLSRAIRHPGILGAPVTKMVRLGERGSTARKIHVLS